MSEPCPRFGKWIGGCRFEGRWEETVDGMNRTPQGAWLVSATGRNQGRRTYVRDVCIRCGKTIERNKDTPT